MPRRTLRAMEKSTLTCRGPRKQLRPKLPISVRLPCGATTISADMWPRGDGTRGHGGMGRIEATGLAHRGSVLATNPTTAREHSHLCDSIMFTPLPNEVIADRKSCLATTNDSGIDFVRRHDHRQESTGNEPDRAAQKGPEFGPRSAPAGHDSGIAGLALRCAM
jgi:hypothetical protein